jgi:hypothetical protein
MIYGIAGKKLSGRSAVEKVSLLLFVLPFNIFWTWMPGMGCDGLSCIEGKSLPFVTTGEKKVVLF